MAKKLNRYEALIEKIFFAHYKEGMIEFEFLREELEQGASELGFARVKNIGDVPYSFRYRNDLPKSILRTQSDQHEWVIEGAGKGKYRFKLVKNIRIVLRDDLAVVDVPDATPELVRFYALDDEQALLAILRYNRLVDTFLGLTSYSLQNHLRTTVDEMGQIEIDELYIGLDKRGCHYAIPVQAKGGKDHIGIVQTIQDIRFVEQKFLGTRCRAIAARFMTDELIAMLELTLRDDEIQVVGESHYRLVSAKKIKVEAIQGYRD